MPFSDVSVVIVTYNSAEVIGECVRSLAAHLPGAQIVLVDNGSSDATLERASAAASTRVVAGHGNVGFGAGVNRGVAAADGELVFVLNPDAVLVEADRAALDALRRSGDGFGIAGARLREPDGSSTARRNSAWGWRAELGWALVQYFLVPREIVLPRPRPLPGSRAAPWISGAGFLVARREFLELGGFDESLFLYYEDFDLSRRYRERGLPLRTTAAVTIAHEGQRSSPRNERLMAAFALMSLVEYVGRWEGPDAAGRAARSCLRQLASIGRLGRALAPLPVLGSRAAKKADEAALVAQALVDVARQPPAPGTYGVASVAITRALARREG